VYNQGKKEVGSMSHSTLTIGQFARRAGLNPKTIRYYEEIGLLPRPARNEAGYRLYSDRDLPRLRFIRRAKMLGLLLAETKHLVDYADDRCCGLLQERLLALVEGKLAEIDRRLAELVALRDDLRDLREDLSGRLEPHALELTSPLDDDACRCIEPGCDPGGARAEP
jgi:MerR family copper efflux transcriptional regulator